MQALEGIYIVAAHPTKADELYVQADSLEYSNDATATKKINFTLPTEH